MRAYTESQGRSNPIHWRVWNDFQEVVDVVTDEERIREMAGIDPDAFVMMWSRKRIHDKQEAKFFGKEEWRDAEDRLLTGWPEGADELRDLGMQLEQSILTDVETTLPAYDVTGQCVDVAAYLTGEPECMITMEPTTVRQHGGILRILIVLDCARDATMQHIMNRGAAIMAMIDIIEAHGCRMEVYGYSGVNGPHYQLVDLVCLKAAHEPMDMDRMAQALCSVSFPRRVMMALFDAWPLRQQSGSMKIIDRSTQMVICNILGSGESRAADLHIYEPALRGVYFDTFHDSRKWAIMHLCRAGFQVSERAGVPA